MLKGLRGDIFCGNTQTRKVISGESREVKMIVSILIEALLHYHDAKKAVKWTTNPQGWDTFANLEITLKERRLKRELSSEETKAIIEKWFQRWPWKPAANKRRI
jgi:hypothetical protein